MSTPKPEEILLFSESAIMVPDDNALRNVTLQFRQRYRWKRKMILVKVYDNRFISLSEKTIKSSKTYWINLCHLDTRPEQQRVVPLYIGAMALLLLACATVLLLLGKFGLIGSLTTIWLGSAALTILALLLLFLMFYKITNYLVFYSDKGQVPMLSFYYNIPNKQVFQKFVSKLISIIVRSKSKSLFNNKQKLAAELSEHRRLRDEGILTPDQYDLAKLNILNSHKLQSKQPVSRKVR